MVVAELTVSFALVVENDCNIPKFLWQMLLVPHGLEQTCQLVVNVFTTCVEHFSRDAVKVFCFYLCNSQWQINELKLKLSHSSSV